MTCATHVAKLWHVIRPATLAFTLAEVLIVLGIIGLIADMTIPTLMNGYEKKETTVKLKQTYSLLNQAFTMSVAENGPSINWEGPTGYTKAETERVISKYFLPYFKYISKSNDFDGYEAVFMNNTPVNNSGNYFVKLANGSLITFGVAQVTLPSGVWSISVHVDTNGLKKPNRMGRDIFHFAIDSSSQIGVLGPAGMPNREDLLNNDSSNFNCNKAALGLRCVRLIMIDNWQIKEDYPWN